MTARATRKKKEPEKLSLEYMPLSELERWPRNPKKHDFPRILESFERWGFTAPVILDEKSKKIAAGNGRQEGLSMRKASGKPPPKRVLLREDGEWLVPVIRGNNFASEEEAELYVIADNRLTELGGWDPGALKEAFAQFDSVTLTTIGFDEAEIARINRLAQGGEQPGKLVSFTANNVPTEHECPRCKFRWSQ